MMRPFSCGSAWSSVMPVADAALSKGRTPMFAVTRRLLMGGKARSTCLALLALALVGAFFRSPPSAAEGPVPVSGAEIKAVADTSARAEHHLQWFEPFTSNKFDAM